MLQPIDGQDTAFFGSLYPFKHNKNAFNSLYFLQFQFNPGKAVQAAGFPFYILDPLIVTNFKLNYSRCTSVLWQWECIDRQNLPSIEFLLQIDTSLCPTGQKIT